MVEIEVEVAGDELEVECPKCGGDGKIDEVLYYVESTGDFVPMDIDEATCPLCEGSGTLEDVPAYGTIYVTYDPEPPRPSR